VQLIIRDLIFLRYAKYTVLRLILRIISEDNTSIQRKRKHFRRRTRKKAE
jgi:hypothetical protein